MERGDLRKWITDMEKFGEIQEIRGADWNLEIGAIANILYESGHSPALLFDDINDYPKGYRILVNSVSSLRRLWLTLGLSGQHKPIEMVKEWKERSKGIKAVPPAVVKDGPILENVHTGKEIDMFEFPSPKWHEFDGGRYIGTGCVVISQDPDGGWVNLGTYRVMVHDDRTLGLFICPGRDGWIHREKHFKRGEPFKVAISFGHDPLVSIVGGIELPQGVSEYDYMGGIIGEPLEVIEGKFTGLPIPAHAEIAIEGECLPGQVRLEGPFGEYTGYYGSSARPEPIVNIKCVMHRNEPILLGMPPVSSFFKCIFTPALIWDQLETSGIQDVRGVWCHERGGSRLFTIVSINQRYPGHVKEVGLTASACRSGAVLGRYVVIVDEDIDPSNIDEVIWAISTRSDPEKDIEIIRRCRSSPLDPILPPGEKYFNSRAIIDACKPYEWIKDFPMSVRYSEEIKKGVMNKWKDILAGAVPDKYEYRT